MYVFHYKNSPNEKIERGEIGKEEEKRRKRRRKEEKER